MERKSKRKQKYFFSDDVQEDLCYLFYPCHKSNATNIFVRNILKFCLNNGI